MAMELSNPTIALPVKAAVDGHTVPEERPLKVEQFLHRADARPVLMVVETFEAGDGSLRRAVRDVPWPGL